MPTSSVLVGRESPLHLTAVGSASSPLGTPSVIERNDSLGDFPVFTAASMVLFGIVGSVAQQAADASVLSGLFHSRQEARCVIAGPATDNCREDEMAAMIGDHRELEKPPHRLRSARSSSAVDEVAAGIMRLKSGGVDTGFARRRQQFEFTSTANNFS